MSDQPNQPELPVRAPAKGPRAPARAHPNGPASVDTATGSGRPSLMLIDASHAMFRAYFAIRNLSSPTGQPTGAVFGFVSMLLKLLRERTPDRIAVCFDTSGPTFRHEMDAAYKANRPDMPDDLAQQWPIAQRVTEELGLPLLVLPGVEADDLIATLATVGRTQGYDVVVVSGDKDLMQLVCDDDGHCGWVRQLDDGKGVLYDPKGVTEKWGLPPALIGDLLAIMGDSSDNIPGVRGIGEKGAVKLLQQWGTLAGVYGHIDEVTPPRTQQLLRESAESAQLSRLLVALKHDVDLPVPFASLGPRGADRAALARSFTDLGFKRLLAEYVDAPEVAVETLQFDTVTDLRDLMGMAEQIRSTRRVAVVALTSHPDPERLLPMWGDLVGLGLSWSPHHVAYVPMAHTGLAATGVKQLPRDEVLTVLRAVLENPDIAKIGHHAKYETLVLRRHGLRVRGWRADAMLASYLHEPERHAHTLRNVAFNLLHATLPPDDELLGRGKSQTGWDAVDIERTAAHTAQKAWLTLRAADALLPSLDETHMRSLYDDLELPLSDVLADMEWAGIEVDVEELHRQGAWLAVEAAKEETAIHDLAGAPFAIGSPQQLGEVLFGKLGLPAKKKTQTGWSTDQSVLESLADQHPICAKVLRWRQLTRLRSTYTEALPLMRLPQTGRVHTCYQQAVAATGRLSSIEPNLQNIPVRSVEGRRIRQAFVAPAGSVLMSADYSQIELRVMAHLANDPGLQSAFKKGLDIHRETAAQMFGLLPEMVTREQRSAAKTIVFGVLYGMGSQRLSKAIGVSLKDAKTFIDKYFERFPGVKAYVERTLQEATTSGEVRTLFGRRRPLPGLSSSSPVERAAAERVAVNTPVQGTAADLIKRAMIEVDRQLKASGVKARLLLQVHDELVLEVPEREVEQVTALVRTAMQGAAELAVPLQVDVGTGRTWAEAH